MICSTPDNITFEVFGISFNGKDVSLDKTFSISNTEANALCKKYGFDRYGVHSNVRQHNYGIVLALFEKIYGFTIGLSGFSGRWDDNNTFVVYWRIDTWKLKRVV